MKETLIILFFFLSINYVNGQNVVINEFMASNSTTIEDEDGDFSDWIELYNTTNSTISLLNYSFSDDSNNLNKWIFPEISISPHGYLLVFASNKNTLDTIELHTNFKISSTGEELYLSNNIGTLINQTNSINLSTDESYARIIDGGPSWVETNTPTPDSINIFNTGIYNAHTSGFYNNSFELDLIKLNKNQQIHYTLNGEIPTINSYMYTHPINISNNSQTPYSISGIPTTPLSGPSHLYDFIWQVPTSVYKCNVVRYAAFEQGILQGKIYSKTYFVDSGVNNKYEIPIVSIITDSLNLFDYDTGIYVPGKRFDEDGFNWWPVGNYHNRGLLWERDVHITLLTHFGGIGFETNAGMRMKGYGSASNPQKSFNVYFREEYGIKKTSYPIFNNPQTEYYKRFTLRNSGNDFIYSHFKDVMLQDVMSIMDLEKQDFKPSILFINGEYWGIHNIREKYDKYYFKYKYGIDENEINILGICGIPEEGSNLDYNNLIDFIEQNDLSIGANYSHVSNKIDINNFIDFQIAEIYFANYDWPCNNFKIWKDNQPDSKWRFLIYDLDLSFGYSANSSYSTASMEHALRVENYWPHCGCSNILLRKLLENEDFKNLFISKFANHLRTTFDVDRIINIIDEFESTYENIIEEHINRWKYPATVSDWENEILILKEFAKNRPCNMSFNIMSFFNLTNFDFDCFVESDEANRFIVGPIPNNGYFFVSNNDLNITNSTITIINIHGQVVYNENSIDLMKGEKKYFDLTNLSNGTYILQIISNNYSGQKKIILLN